LRGGPWRAIRCLDRPRPRRPNGEPRNVPN
jgi:hypothetical protein